ncbi:hypothetical protein L1987_07815 [Smallanthus sonchifolius]|uniref:Uncharacterized protein n=1 Tax=Smallanthus sonchifolius TaxID=185202 RepID=A0ACB9JKM5_9ASTR|nr:hypothetical protein L1987_07815 [Smallanthus sonchifolius]
MRQLQHFTILIVILSRTKATVVQSLPGCSDKCGNITIPYPFGIEENCYLDKVYQAGSGLFNLDKIYYPLIKKHRESRELEFR